MGVVFRAQQLSTNREVALKVVKVDTDDDTRIERFRQEIDIISRLSHPNIVRVFDTGTIKEHDLLYVVMEYVDGLSLHELMWRRKGAGEEGYFKCRIRVELALEVVYQICGALTEPHRQEIIHRDLKPENIVLAPSFDETIQVKVLDFGIALVLNGASKQSQRMTVDRIPFVGTPHYMAPEQIARTQYDMRTDLYAIGVLLYEMLCGSAPFEDDNLLALLLKKSQEDAPPLLGQVQGDYPFPDVARLADSLLSRDVSRRPQSALEVRREVERIRDLHRFTRVRVDASNYLDQSKIPGFQRDREKNANEIAKLFDPWLTYPSGEPLIPRVNQTWQRLGLEPPISEVQDLDQSKELTIRHMSAVVEEPKRNKMRSWNVDAAWTDSLNSDALAAQDFHQMASWLEEESEGSEGVDQVVTTIWKPDFEQMAQFAKSFETQAKESDLPLAQASADFSSYVTQPIVPSEPPASSFMPSAHSLEAPTDEVFDTIQDPSPVAAMRAVIGQRKPVEFLEDDDVPLASSSPSALIRDAKTTPVTPSLDDLVATVRSLPPMRPLPAQHPLPPAVGEPQAPQGVTGPEVSSLILHPVDALGGENEGMEPMKVVMVSLIAMAIVGIIGVVVYMMIETF